MSQKKKVLFVRFYESIGAGILQALFEKEGFATETFDLVNREQKIPVTETSILVFLGGEMSVYETETYPQLITAMEAIHEGIKLGKPILGVCLGGQLIAQALGAKVYRNSIKELGYRAVTFDPIVENDPVLSFSKGTHYLFEWHGDTFEIPEGSRVLASSPTCKNQAFSPAHGVYALQFHLEMYHDAFKKWMEYQGNIDELAEEKQTVNELIEQHKLHGDKHVVWTTEFVHRLCKLA